jgi:phosphonate transport system substrate-binding protein
VQIRHGNGSLGYRSCLIVPTDSDIFSPEDIGGKTFAFNDPNSTSGYLVPMTMFLNEMGTTRSNISLNSPSQAHTRRLFWR